MKKKLKKLNLAELEINSFVTSLEKEEEKALQGGQSGQPCGGTYNINCTGGFICTHFCLDTRLC